MAARLQPFSFDPWAARQPFTPNLYGAYFPLPIPAGTSLPVTVFAQPETARLPGYRRSNSTAALKVKPSFRPPYHENRQPRRPKRCEDGHLPQLKRKPTKKHRRRSQKKFRHAKAPRSADEHATQQAGALRERSHQLPLPPPQPTPYTSRQCVEDAAELNVNPYGTMAGMIELQQGAAPLAFEEHRSEDGPSSSVDGLSTSGSDGEDAEGQHDQQQPAPTVAFGPAKNFDVGMLGDPNRQGDSFLRVRLEEQEAHLSQLEEDNLTLREKLFLVQQELEELRRRASGSTAEAQAVEGENSVVWGGPCES